MEIFRRRHLNAANAHPIGFAPGLLLQQYYSTAVQYSTVVYRTATASEKLRIQIDIDVLARHVQNS